MSLEELHRLQRQLDEYIACCSGEYEALTSESDKKLLGSVRECREAVGEALAETEAMMDSFDQAVVPRDDGKVMYAVYQIDFEKHTGLSFKGSDQIPGFGTEFPKKEIYCCVYGGTINPAYAAKHPIQDVLESVYTLLNGDKRPRRLDMNAMSVSDIVAIRNGMETSLWFVDHAGFKKIDDGWVTP